MDARGAGSGRGRGLRPCRLAGTHAGRRRRHRRGDGAGGAGRREDLPHPPIEAVSSPWTRRSGMVGAAAHGRLSTCAGGGCINIDSEEEGVFTVGCAGGATARCVLPVTRTACAGHAMTVTVSGLRGGHSGSEIHKGRGNASILLGRISQSRGRHPSRQCRRRHVRQRHHARGERDRHHRRPG